MTLNFLWATTLLALLAGPASAATLSFSAVPTPVHVGDAFALDVRVADVTDLYGFQFDLGFDPTIIRAVEVGEGNFLASGGGATSFVPGDIDNTLGLVLFTGNTLLGPAGGVSGEGVLAHLKFQALAEGRSPLVFGNVVLIDSTLADIGNTPFSRTIDVAAVPEPATALLASIGLAALAATLHGRRRGIAESTSCLNRSRAPAATRPASPAMEAPQR
jgi:hypothetical protein